MNIFSKIKAYFADTPDDYEAVGLRIPADQIPPGAILCVRSKSLIGYVIRKVTSAWCNHIAIYIGSGRQAVVEALSDGMVETTLKDSMNPKTQFKVYVNPYITVSQLQIIKAYAYGTLGKKYGWTEILRFLGPAWAKVFRPKNSTAFCSEDAVESFAMAGIKISEKKACDTSPDDVEDYLNSDSGRNAGWYLMDTYNC